MSNARILAFVGLIAALGAAPAFAGPVSLKAQPVAKGPSVTLADIFDGATGPGAAVVVARTPAPGLNAVLDAVQVQRTARAHGLDWNNVQGVRRIIVTSMQGAPADAAAGRPERARQVLSYARNINVGERVDASDLVWSDGLVAPSDAPSDPEAVIGMVARRPLRLGAAVGGHDVAPPKVVHRDEIVSVAYRLNGISLVLQAKAMADAAVGESVQVMNPQSKKVIEAVASGPGQAVVGPEAQRLKSLAPSALSIATR
jgi:flagella basal body P-ring formation protein FlgA